MSETGAKDSGWAWPFASRLLDTSAARFASPVPAPTEAASKSCSGQPFNQPFNPSSPSCRASVLIVEDDRAARTAISAILRRKGFAVSEVSTVAEALRAVIADAGGPPQ